MVLQEEFRNNGYEDILTANVAAEYNIDLEDIFDDKPEELLSIFISKYKDDMFFLLNGDIKSINELCEFWDNRIRVFTILQGRSEIMRKLKYNIVQLIVYSGDMPDKSRESDLFISRKIILKGDLSNKSQIIINDDEVIELPFHMIPTDDFLPDEKKNRELDQLLPKEESLLELMEKRRKRVIRKQKKGIIDKSFSLQDFEKIKGWLIR